MSALRRHPRIPISAGFTLIEMVMTILIAAFGAALIFSAFGTVLSNAHRPGEMVQADFLANELAEEAKAARYGNVDTAITNQTIPGFTGFTRSRSAPTAVAAGTGGCPATGALCQEVEITVSVSGTLSARQTVLLMQGAP